MVRRDFLTGAAAALLVPGCSEARIQNVVFAQYLSENRELHKPQTLVVESVTCSLDQLQLHRLHADQLRSALPKMGESTAARLLAPSPARRVSLPVAHLPSTLGISYVTPTQIASILAPSTRPWEPFHEQFPGALGLLRLSNVAFSAARDQAAFGLSFQCGMLCGSGFVVLMARSAGRWRTEDSQNIWVS